MQPVYIIYIIVMDKSVAVLLLFVVTCRGQEGGAQNCVSTFAQATCMGPWFGWNEPSHLSQGRLRLNERENENTEKNMQRESLLIGSDFLRFSAQL